MANIRIKDLSTDSALSAGDYVVVDSASEGSRKFDLGAELTSLKEDIENISGISDDVKAALLQIASKVAYIDDDGQDYYDALEAALYPVELLSISAEYTQSGTIYDTYVLNTLIDDLVVTAHWLNSADTIIPSSLYTLSGTLEYGTSTITVTYQDKTTTFDVNVSSRIPSEYKQIEYIQSDFTQAIQTNIIPRDTRTLVTFEFVEIRDSADNYVVGVYNANNQRYYPAWANIDGKINFKNRGNTSKWVDTNSPLGKHTIDFNNSSHQAIFDGSVKATDSTFALTAENNKIAIFARGHSDSSTYSSNVSATKLYSLKFENNADGTAVGEFFPCYRKSDNVAGLYDTVSQEFYTDILSGNAFGKGADAWETGT